jgi:hypothetical protein
MASTPWSRNQKLYAGTLFAVAISGLAALVMIAIELRKLSTAEYARAEDDRSQKVQDWQRVVVYNILDAKMNRDRGALAIDEIRNEYVSQAATVNGLDLKKEELQDLALRRILLDLMSSGLVYETGKGKYVVQQSELNLKFDRQFLQSDAVSKILTVVNDESGKYTVAELDPKLRDELKLSKEEFNKVVLELVAYNWINIDHQGKLTSRLKP